MNSAIVTGASAGIGRDVAVGLAADGFRVALIGRNPTTLKETERLIQERGKSETLVIPCDVSDELAVKSAMDSILSQWKSVDLLFNNAGIWKRGTGDLDPKDFRELFEVNVIGAWNVIHHLAPSMIAQKHGVIFNVSSVAGREGFAGIGAYCSSKFALGGLSEALGKELASANIKVTTICPGWTNTNMSYDVAACPHPRESIVQTGDILAAVKFVLSLSPGATVPELVLQSMVDLNS